MTSLFCNTSPGSAQLNCQDTPEGRVCSVQQPIVNGTLVPVQTQRDLGLMTVGGGCSGTLINRYWVLTADHCLTTNGQINGPSQSLNNLVITAAWSPEQVVPTRLVRNWGAGGLDIGLVYLGAGDFGKTFIQLLAVDAPEVGSALTKFGRGISAFASAGPPPVPAVNDGLYRSAQFTVSSTSAVSYAFPINAANQIADGGDGGGPDFLTAPNGVFVGIAGVQSGCTATGTVPGQPLVLPGGGINWMWVTGISTCSSAPLADARFDIVQISQEAPVVMTAVHYYEVLQ